METIEAKKTFKKALVEAGKVKFDDGWPGEGIVVDPEAILICSSKKCCNIGSTGTACVHRFTIRNIPFCIY